MTRIDGETVATWQDVRWMLLKQVMKKHAVEIESRNAARRNTVRTRLM